MVRWTLRRYILVPFLSLISLTLLAVTFANIYFVGVRESVQMRGRLAGVVQTIATGRYPLTDQVLQQMTGLSGAEFIWVDSTDAIRAKSWSPQVMPVLTNAKMGESAQQLVPLGRRTKIDSQVYYQSYLNMSGPNGRSGTLHIFYPEQSLRAMWSEASLLPFMVGMVSLLVTIGVANRLAARVVRPIHQLRNQVTRLANGTYDWEPVPLQPEELQELGLAMNQLSQRLKGYEVSVRQHERVKTLSQLGGGLAHQVKNSLTGCRMALELHARECSSRDETLDVAIRQVALIDEYVRRFLALGKPIAPTLAPLDLRDIVDQAVQLVNAAAQHAHIPLIWLRPVQPCVVKGDSVNLQQVVINLLLNAIEAVAKLPLPATTVGQIVDRNDAWIRVDLTMAGQTELSMTVSNIGDGPPSSVAGNLFEPLVTTKPEGGGLGLAVAREIVEQHHGWIDWQQEAKVTRFRVTLPQCTEEISGVESTCR